MYDRPTAAELTEAVREYLERDVQPRLDGRVAFHLRVALNVLSMLERELADAGASDRDQRARLRAILGHDGETATLERELASGVRAGSIPISGDVLNHVRASVREKLLVANPKYLED
jgi:hypothetical protein